MSASWIDTPGVDPLLLWAEATGHAHFLRAREPLPRLIPTILALRAGASAAALHAALRGSGGSVPPAYRATALRHCTAWLPRNVLDRARVARLIERFELQSPVIPLRPRPVAAAPAPTTLRDAGTRPRSAGRLLVGAIDSACAFAHQRLRDASGGTRLLHLWDQGTPIAAHAQPAEFGYGHEFSRRELNALMNRVRRERGALDEAACYAAAGMGALRQRDVHGVAVLDLLAGRWPLAERLEPQPGRPPRWPRSVADDDPAGCADLVFVQLPRDVVQDSSSAGLARHLLDGLRYILACAGPRTEHIVVNISDGTSRGSHDGGSLIEQAFAEAVAEQAARGVRLDIVLPAGNLGDERRHARWDGLRPGAPAQVRLALPPDSQAPAWVVLLLPAHEAGRVTVTLAPPGSRGVLRTRAGQLVQGAGAGIVFPRAAGAAQNRLTVLIAIDPAAPCGEWSLRIEVDRPFAGTVEAHIARNQTNLGAMRRGLQARFVDAAYDDWRFMRPAHEDNPRSPVQRDGAVNGLATGAAVWVAGGVDRRSGEAALYASRDRQRALPAVSLPADESQGLRGLRTAGSLSGQTARMQGTSFCAPQLARHLCRPQAVPPEPAPRQRWRERRRPGQTAAPLPAPPVRDVER